MGHFRPMYVLILRQRILGRHPKLQAAAEEGGY
jgi:hypothetical protein